MLLRVIVHVANLQLYPLHYDINSCFFTKPLYCIKGDIRTDFSGGREEKIGYVEDYG